MELVWRKQNSWAFRSIDCELLSCCQFWFIKWIQHKHLLIENYAFSAEIVSHFLPAKDIFWCYSQSPPSIILKPLLHPNPLGLIISNLPPPPHFPLWFLSLLASIFTLKSWMSRVCFSSCFIHHKCSLYDDTMHMGGHKCISLLLCQVLSKLCRQSHHHNFAKCYLICVGF